MWSRLQDLDLLDPAKRSGPRELDPTRPGTLPSPRRSMTDNLQTFSFTLLLSGPDATESPVIDLLHEAGCDDALFGQRDQIQYGGFDRDAKSLAEAVISAIRQVESVPGLRVLRVEPDELVSATVIAERTKRSRESVRLLVEGKRGPGGFPAPISWVDAKRRLWQWSDVARWFADELGDDSWASGDTETIAVINAALETRNRLERLDAHTRGQVTQLVRSAVLRP